MKTTRLAITVTISLGLFALNYAAFAEDTASFAKIDVTYHQSTNVLEITGIVYKTFSQNYVLTIFNPEGRLVEVSQLQLSQDGTFSQSILTSNTLWSEPGNYTAKLTSAPQVLSEKLFYFPGTSCCIKNSHGVQAGPSKTSSSIDSPLKQFQSGVAAKDVHCSDELILVIKAEDGSPACVKPDTAHMLIQRGWAEGNFSPNMWNVSPNAITKGTSYCKENETMIDGGYQLQNGSPIRILNETRIIGSSGQQGMEIEFLNPDKLSWMAWVWVDCGG
ncbi:MAG: hypothetical protein KGI27_10955 [Thaumarchaeota archaeon]|nr:hypothetical protein [Nitrososphaerota archaeon]